MLVKRISVPTCRPRRLLGSGRRQFNGLDGRDVCCTSRSSMDLNGIKDFKCSASCGWCVQCLQSSTNRCENGSGHVASVSEVCPTNLSAEGAGKNSRRGEALPKKTEARSGLLAFQRRCQTSVRSFRATPLVAGCAMAGHQQLKPQSTSGSAYIDSSLGMDSSLARGSAIFRQPTYAATTMLQAHTSVLPFVHDVPSSPSRVCRT